MYDSPSPPCAYSELCRRRNKYTPSVAILEHVQQLIVDRPAGELKRELWGMQEDIKLSM